MKKEEAESLANKHRSAFAKEGIKIIPVRHPTGDRTTKKQAHEDHCVLCVFPQGDMRVYSTKASFEANRKALRSESDTDDLGWW